MKPAKETIRVMLIDDHQTMLWGLGKLIDGEKPRMEVVGTARGCEEALAKIEQLVPDVILLDLDLDGKNGLDILPALLTNGISRVLILTGERRQATLDMAVLSGARGIVHKDASAEQVLKAIEKTHRGELWLDREALGRVFGELMTPAAVRKPDCEAEKKATLTAKEQKIIHTIIEGSGASNKTLAQRLFISEHTLCNHLTSIYHKLDVSNRLELYVYATKHQLGNPNP
ncbi:two component transcriptional regulator, LuxR family [Collimonas sp. OK607]|uniref:response regulator n=1 Tax=Collimonas sp. OK607 TaxID=1798194 RepID=UPI0008E9CB92|nr:response regulator transcription factor [Collimonas sp. OK607]SFB33254.1 two component transcriptional regulator, LuxR family [Collimonas sp. OK607]